MPVKLLGAVAAEHAGANDDGIEGIGSRPLRRCYFLPIVANVAGDNVVAEIGPLNIVLGRVGRCYELIERHDDLLGTRSWPTYQCKSEPNILWLSTSKLPKPSVSSSQRRCSRADEV